MDDRSDIQAQLKAYSEAKKMDFANKKTAGGGSVVIASERTYLLSGETSTEAGSDRNYTCSCFRKMWLNCCADCQIVGSSLQVCFIPVGSKLVPLRIHYTWPLFLIFTAIPAFYSSVAVGIFSLVLLGPVLLLTVLLHELGHACMATILGGDVSQILIWPLGGIAYISFYGDQNPKVDALVAIAGPLTHIPQIALWCAAMYVSNRGVVELFWPLQWGWDFWLALCSAAIFLQIALFLFNLIPAYPLDGGRLLGAFLSSLKFNRNIVFMTTAFVGGLFGWYFLIEGFRGSDSFSDNMLFSSGNKLMIGIFLLINSVELWVLGMRGAASQHSGFEWAHGARPADEDPSSSAASGTGVGTGAGAAAATTAQHRIYRHGQGQGQGHVSGFVASHDEPSQQQHHHQAGGGNTALHFGNNNNSGAGGAGGGAHKMPGVGHRLGTADDEKV